MKVLQLFFLFTIISCFISCSSGNSKEKSERPNILFIAIDDLRPDINLYGNRLIKSPHLDDLGEESLVFNRAYCNVPVCGASRASLLTGARPTRSRYVLYSASKDEQNPDVVSLPMVFKNNGYTTISNGKVYHHTYDDSLAWNEIWKPDPKYHYATEEYRKIRANTFRGMPMESAAVHDSIYPDGKITLKAINDLKKLKEDGNPFFLALGFFKPHLPFNAPKRYWDMYNREDISLPENYFRPKSTPKQAYHNFGELRNYETIPKKGDLDEDLAKELIHGYYACVSYIDTQIGLILEEIKNLELDKNTIVVLWGDHGWNLGNHKLWAKHCTFESSLHAPLIIKVPGKTTGTTTDAITEFVDIYPTLCDLAGIEKPRHLEGESLLPIIENGKREKDYAVSKFKDAVTLIQGTLFYTEWTNGRGEQYARMLFDHETDPLEVNNLAEKVEYEELVNQLSIELREKWGKDFLNGTK